MRLRKLEEKDIPYMLEWMHDRSINCFFRFDAEAQTTESVRSFIQKANTNENNEVHFAIASDEDTYMGTVSLKNIDQEVHQAEYAISVRKAFHGKSTASFATQEILKYAFDILGLNRVYLNVLPENIRAYKFYEKFGFVFEGEFFEAICIKGKIMNLKWYRLLKREYEALMEKSS